MFPNPSAFRGARLAALALATLAVTASAAASAPCFYITAWRGWSSPSPTVLLLKVNSDVYRVDLSVGSANLSSPAMHLVSKVRNSSSICSPLDLNLALATQDGVLEPLVAKAITKLTPEEAAAIPPKFRP